MPNALIYSSSFDGHRQVFVYVISQILSELGYKIYISGNFKEEITNSFYIEKLKKDKSIILLDTSFFAQGAMNITVTDFIAIQKRNNIDLTVFAEGDHHIPLFNSQILNKQNKLRGRTIGIFLRPFYYYEKLSFINKLRYIKNLKNRWKTDNRLFHGLFLKYFRLLDSALYIDEYFVSSHSFSKWLPDVFQQYAETLVIEENPEQRVWIEKLNAFKERNTDRIIFLYFGTAQKRRGYDMLLKMAVENKACFIHCGLTDSKEKYEYDDRELKSILQDDGRLLETNQYISDPLCIEHFFKSVNYLVLPYRNFLGSSGVMLQALYYRIPVLVPEKGIMGYRVKKHNLGLTYNGDYDSLTEQFNIFKDIPKDSYAEGIGQYMQYQSKDRLKEILIKELTIKGF